LGDAYFVARHDPKVVAARATPHLITQPDGGKLLIDHVSPSV
jgi:hypothetical protein